MKTGIRKIIAVICCCVLVFSLFSCSMDGNGEKGKYEVNFQQIEGDAAIQEDQESFPCMLLCFVSGDVEAFEQHCMEAEESMENPVFAEGFQIENVELSESTYRKRDKACYSVFFDLIPEEDESVLTQIEFFGETYPIGELNIGKAFPERYGLQVDSITGSVAGLGMQEFNVTLRNTGAVPVWIKSIDYGSLEHLRRNTMVNDKVVHEIKINAGESVKLCIPPKEGSEHKMYYLTPTFSCLDGTGNLWIFTPGTVIFGNEPDDIEALAEEIFNRE